MCVQRGRPAVFDIGNPTRPVEIAYYVPPGRRTEARSGSGLSIRFSCADRTADWVIQVSRFDRERNEIWFMSQDNGLQIVRFTDRFRATRRNLFGSRQARQTESARTDVDRAVLGLRAVGRVR